MHIIAITKKMNTQENIENKIHNAVVSEIDRNKMHIRDLNSFLVKKYKNAGGRKKHHMMTMILGLVMMMSLKDMNWIFFGIYSKIPIVK